MEVYINAEPIRIHHVIECDWLRFDRYLSKELVECGRKTIDYYRRVCASLHRSCPCMIHVVYSSALVSCLHGLECYVTLVT